MAKIETLGAKIPPHLAEKVPSVLTAFTQISMAVNVRQELDPVLKVAECLKPDNSVDMFTATKLLDKCKDYKNITENRTAIHWNMLWRDGCSDHVQNIMEQTLREVVDKVLISSAVVGGVHLLSTFLAVTDLLEQIEKAGILAKETIAETREIVRLLEAIPQKLVEFANIVVEMQSQETMSQEIMRLNLLQKRKATSIESVLAKAEAMIVKTVERNQEVRTALEKTRKGASSAGFNAILGGCTNIVNAGILHQAASPYLLVLNVGIGAFNIILGGVAIQKAKSTKEKIDVIVSHINGLKVLKNDADQYRRELNEKKQEILDMLMAICFSEKK